MWPITRQSHAGSSPAGVWREDFPVQPVRGLAPPQYGACWPSPRSRRRCFCRSDSCSSWHGRNEIAAGHGAFRLKTIRALVERQGQKQQVQETFEFMDRHPIIRSLDDYGQIVRSALMKESMT